MKIKSVNDGQASVHEASILVKAQEAWRRGIEKRRNELPKRARDCIWIYYIRNPSGRGGWPSHRGADGLYARLAIDVTSG
jgi:hypothetical protein